MATQNSLFSWLPENTPAQRLVRALVIFAIFSSPVWGYWLYSKYQQRQECESLIRFVPATESVSGTSVWTDKQGESEHYEYAASGLADIGGPRKFKTKQEAVQHCVGERR